MYKICEVVGRNNMSGGRVGMMAWRARSVEKDPVENKFMK